MVAEEWDFEENIVVALENIGEQLKRIATCMELEKNDEIIEEQRRRKEIKKSLNKGVLINYVKI